MTLLSLSPTVFLPREAVVGVFDLDTATVSGHTREFLRRAQEAGNVTTIGEELPQAFIVTSANAFSRKSVCAVDALVSESAQNYICLSAQSSANLSKKLLTRP